MKHASCKNSFLQTIITRFSPSDVFDTSVVGVGAAVDIVVFKIVSEFWVVGAAFGLVVFEVVFESVTEALVDDAGFIVVVFFVVVAGLAVVIVVLSSGS